MLGLSLMLTTACATAHAAPLTTQASFVSKADPRPPIDKPKSDVSLSKNAGNQYVVQPGDTLWRISQRFAMSVTELRSLNQLETNNAIRVGQTLKVQGGEPAGPSSKTQAALASLKAKTAVAEQGDDPVKTPPASATLSTTKPSSGLSSATKPTPGNESAATKPEVAKTTAALTTPRPIPVNGAGASPMSRPRKYPLLWPVEGVLTSRFGGRNGRSHDGIDIGAAPGTKVKAAADGDVIFADTHGSYGNLVLVRHGNGLVTVYAHNSKNLVNKGQRVKAGQAIATVGSTGHSTGPHLHFEVRRGVQAENPLGLLPP